MHGRRILPDEEGLAVRLVVDGLGLSEEDTLRARELGWLEVAGVGRYVLTQAGRAAAKADQGR